jgi:hypothetical protein
MKLKQFVVGASFAAAAAVLATTLVASAQTATSTPGAASHSQPMVLQIGPNGRALLRGTIASVNSGALTVNSWGGVWTVNVGSGAKVMPAVSGNDISQFKTGDFVGIEGTVSQGAAWTIDATLVRDWTDRAVVGQEVKQNVKEARQIQQASRPRNYIGTVSGVSAGSFTLTAGGTAYTVNPTSGAEIVNRNWIAMPLSGIQTNDNVRVWGTEASGTISAAIVRDVSIPAASSTAR